MADVGAALIEANVLSEQQVETARRAGDGPLALAIVKQKLLGEEDYVRHVTAKFGLPAAPLVRGGIDKAVVGNFPERMARSLQAVPISREGAEVTVAVADPSDPSLPDRLSRALGGMVKLEVGGPVAVANAIDEAFGGGGASAPEDRASPGDHAPPVEKLDKFINAAIQEIHPETDDDGDDQLQKLEVRELDPPVIRLINSLLLKTLKLGGSDIHIEPGEDKLKVRLRIDGHLHEILEVSGEMKGAISSSLKIMADMDIAEKRVPQDGGIKFALGPNEHIDFRVSSLPTLYGEKIVMRVLGTSELRESIEDLGFEGRALETIREAVSNPYGMILVTGPTGSGKTTTLYTILNQLNDPGVNIVTAEDPVEYRLPGITQVGIRTSSGLTFDKALKSFLRQDPDIILVGEMRDYETAAIAVKAALTGHLVLSTLHTNDAPSTVVRLVDMGIEPYLVASAVKVVVAQRLIRRICSKCKEEVDLAELERSDLDQNSLAAIERLYRGKGCDACNNSGHKGRVPVFEVLGVKSKEMKRAITEGGTEVQVGQIARREGMIGLPEAAIELVNQGVTSIEEAGRIIIAE